jgi:hypothetical protein
MRVDKHHKSKPYHVEFTDGAWHIWRGTGMTSLAFPTRKLAREEARRLNADEPMRRHLEKQADHIDGLDRDDLGESPDF